MTTTDQPTTAQQTASVPFDEAEVERLHDIDQAAADDYWRGCADDEPVRHSTLAGTRALLADVVARWHLLPRDGAQDGHQWGRRAPRAIPDLCDAGYVFVAKNEAAARGITDSRTELVRRRTRVVVAGPGETWTYHGPWEPAE